MPKLTIAGINPLIDGAYEIEVQSFTGRELHAIKKLTDLRPAEFEEAFGALDNDVIMALAMVVLMRAGKITHGQAWLSDQVASLMDAQVGKISFNVSDLDEEQAADAGPPSPSSTESDASVTSADFSEPSGNGSSESSDHLARIPPLTGVPPLDTGSTSDPAISAI